ncbi:MAG: sigma-70 family RNA polymerase sigma factor [Anaerolineae bacterium]|nr:sigma-70 family RNA polymerase sigma factor [Anaerolineae bacterium]NIN95102.1 sigma-70 family RNA polymerase sigma factor [Anaerolineae bacterium]NIQ78954.1 sigma-70 family RNA polymerase sigma factor [Anaerolineae bacterium]
MNEKALIASAKQGDTRAFNQLVAQYQDMVYNLAYRILSDPEAAADASQDAFLSAFQAVAKFKGGSFKAWLLRITTNACYDQLRLHKRRPTSSLEAVYTETDHSSFFVNGQESPEEHTLRHELGQTIQMGIGSLTFDQRVTLVLSDVQGMSYSEIAEATGVTVGTVKSRLSRARSSLRDYLLDQGELLPARYRLKGEDQDA